MGFYTFLFATAISLVIGHISIYFHRKAQEPVHYATGLNTVIQCSEVVNVAVMNHLFSIPAETGAVLDKDISPLVMSNGSAIPAAGDYFLSLTLMGKLFVPIFICGKIYYTTLKV